MRNKEVVKVTKGTELHHYAERPHSDSNEADEIFVAKAAHQTDFFAEVSEAIGAEDL